MKSTLVLAAVVAGVSAQKCQKLADIKPIADPLKLFPPSTATFPCDMGSAVPLGKIPQGCGQLEIIVARGTSEPGDLGMVVGDPLVARVKRDLPGVKVIGYPVQYPASMSGSATGVADVGKRIAAQAKACPDAKFALAGYSQGGMVTLQAAGKLSKELQDKVVAVVLYGSGDGSQVTAGLKAKTIANCAPGDFACPKAGSGPGHVSYNNEGTIWHDRSSQYIVSAYKGQPLGQKLMRSATDKL